MPGGYLLPLVATRKTEPRQADAQQRERSGFRNGDERGNCARVDKHVDSVAAIADRAQAAEAGGAGFRT